MLCYGDSNTWGAPPEVDGGRRLPADVRWTGQLQRLLSEGFVVIEEGLGGRTTDVDYSAGDRPGRNGRTYLVPCLLSHEPLDVVVLMLGTNDLKRQFHRSPDEIVAAVGRLMDDIAAHAVDQENTPVRIVLLSPAVLDDRVTALDPENPIYDAESVAKSRELAPRLRALAEARGAVFADAAQVAKVGDDGVHLDRDSHRAMAELVAGLIGS